MRTDLALAALLAATMAVMLVFGLWPGLDLAASAQFYDGSGFPVSDQPVIEPSSSTAAKPRSSWRWR